ncbi:MAG: hypothetical protein IKG82_04500 [Oscillospiraceae bacterium]|nr:hypothetical protein [Oscillospiraceae bacterium]MBR3417933.1 hypothetical protein [Oscillospiraceae bacterium]
MQKETGFNPYPPEETLPADALAHYERNAAGLYLVHLSEFYDEVDPNQEPEAVEESVLLTLIQFKREEKKREMHDYRHRVNFGFDEVLAAALDGIREPSAADVYERERFSSRLEAALDKLHTVAKRRVCLLYFEKYTQVQIAEMEHVTQGAVQKSIAAALKALRKFLAESDK